MNPPESETPETDAMYGPQAEQLEPDDAGAALARSLEHRLFLAQTEIKGHMRVVDELKAELQIVQPKAQVMHDLHDALGVKWGCDPYAEIRRLKGIEKLCEEILAQNTQAQARIAELEKDAARYRWLRDNAETINGEKINWHCQDEYRPHPPMQSLDAAIDAARKDRA